MWKWITMPVVALVATVSAQAAQVKQGEVICSSEQALLELQAAQRRGDSKAVYWLYNGDACLHAPEDTPISVLGESDAGNRKIKTVNRRRNRVFWVHADSLR